MILLIVISIALQIIGSFGGFGKALPILKEGHITEEQLPAVESVLKTAAFTYFAAALSSVLNLGYLMMLLRR